MNRDFDLVLFGATGFTGRLCAEYLAQRQELDATRWAIAGRQRSKLEELRVHLTSIDSRLSKLAIIEASSDSLLNLRAMAARTRVIATTVGPYRIHGLALVEACVAEGTHVCDITGEPEFVAETLSRFGDLARQKNISVVSTCGFDSVPHDFGAWLTVRALPPSDKPTTVHGFVSAKGTFSGGTWQSAVGAMARIKQSAAAVKRSRVEPRDGRRVAAAKEGFRYDKRMEAWAVPLPTIDPAVVLRSASELTEYGQSFRYGHFAKVKSLATVVASGFFLGGVAALAQVPASRSWLLKQRASGDGPSAEERARSRFTVHFFGERGPHRSEVIVSGKDPGYDETAKMLGEAALCLACDDKLRPTARGVQTPVVALGDAYLNRLRRAGLKFDIKAGLDPWAP